MSNKDILGIIDIIICVIFLVYFISISAIGMYFKRVKLIFIDIALVLFSTAFVIFLVWSTM